VDTRTGAIAHFETLADAERAGYDQPLTKPQFTALAPLTREERLTWLQRRRKRSNKRKSR
jgi:hypothetical protein